MFAKLPGGTSGQLVKETDDIRTAMASSAGVARKMSREVTFAVEGPAGSVQNLRVRFTKLGSEMGQVAIQAQYMNKELSTREGMSLAFRRVAMWGSAAGILYGAIRVLRSGIRTMTEVETGVIALSKVMREADEDFEHFKSTAVAFAKTLAVDFGSGIKEALESMKVFAQQGLNMAEVQQLTRATALAANVTVLNQAQAAEVLTSATRQFNIEASKAIGIVDALNQVSNRNAVTELVLADAFRKAGSAASTVGVQFEQFLGMVTAIGTATRAPGREIGTSLRFIFQRTLRPDTQKALEKIGISTTDLRGQFKGFVPVLNELASKWEDLSKTQQLAIAQALGGARQYNAFLALMNNFGIAIKATRDAFTSQGSAAAENAKVMGTTVKVMAQLKAAVDGVAISFGKALLPAIKIVAAGFKAVFDFINRFPDALKAVVVGVTLASVAVTRFGHSLDMLSTSTAVSGGVGAGGLFASIAAGLGSGPRDVSQLSDIQKIKLTGLQRELKGVGDFSRGAGIALSGSGRQLTAFAAGAKVAAAEASKFTLVVTRARIATTGILATEALGRFQDLNGLLAKLALIPIRIGQGFLRMGAVMVAAVTATARKIGIATVAWAGYTKATLTARAATAGVGLSLLGLAAGAVAIYALVKLFGLLDSTVIKTGKDIEKSLTPELTKRESLLRQLQ